MLGAKDTMRGKNLKTWLTQGTYPRLFIPIFLIILTVTVVRHHYLIAAEMEEAKDRVDTAVGRLGHFLAPALASTNGSGSAVVTQKLLDAEIRFNPDIEALAWQLDGIRAQALHRNTTPTNAPRWFIALVHTERLEKQFSQTRADGQVGTLTVVIRPDASIQDVWNTVATQMLISALNVLIILLLLTLLLRANARMLSRLALATVNFKSGRLETRMGVNGTLEARAVAQTFNGMAEQVELLVKSLQETQAQQTEQLHFTRQLVDALPLPIFVRSTRGTCLAVNQAWEKLFYLQAHEVVGKPMHSNFSDWHGEKNALPALEDGTDFATPGNEISLQDPHGKTLAMSYFKAAFTNVDGIEVGSIATLVDITDRKQAQEALMAEKERAEVTLASIGDGVITTDLRGYVDSINEAAQFLTGYTASQATGRALAEVFRLCDNSAMVPNATVQASNQVLLHRSGERYNIEYTRAPIRKRDGTKTGTVFVIRDVTETQNLKQTVSWQARHDALTGLPNRTALAECMTHSAFTAKQDGTLLAVCLLDLDFFQNINDQHGSWTGDRLLKEVASRMQTFISTREMVARIGGDEFVLLLGGYQDIPAIENRIAQLLQQLAVPYAIDSLAIETTASIGVTIFPQDEVNPDTLLRHADQAMFQAKAMGRNRLHLFNAKLDQEVQTKHSKQTRIAQALARGELRVYYQPKVNMRTRKVVGMEALLRWQHPEEGLLGPVHFLPLVETTELIDDIGEWVLHQALSQMKVWAATGHAWMVSVNIAARHFHRPDFVARLKEILVVHPDVPPTMLELEILESAALEDVQHMCNVMESCQALGVRFSLDDFGTGFSSLSYLKRLPAETIKIDQSFVRGILDSHDDLTLVSAIVALAKAFHRHVIAEGVETEAQSQSQRLLELGCELGQGFGIGRPMPAWEVALWASDYQALQNH